MSTNRSLHKVVWFILTIFTLCGCKSCKEECDDPTNPECPNYDPCFGLQLPDQNLTITASGYEALDHDTIWCLSDVSFEVKEPADSVFWKIGADPTIHQGNSMDIYFGTPYQNVQIRCISYRKDNVMCNGQSLKVDTVLKTLTLVHWPDLPIWNWEFDGAFEDTPNENKHVSFTYELSANSNPLHPTGERYILGLTELCGVGNCQGILAGGFNHRKINPDSPCCGPGIGDGTGYVSLDKQTLKLSYFTANGWKTFHGTKSN
jgi:hypothetical protein